MAISRMSNADLTVVKLWPVIEAFVEIISKLLGLCIIYFMFNLAGKELLGEDFSPDTLLSLVILPALYILKDSHLVLEPCFIKASISDTNVKVRSGILTKKLDSLSLATVENVELVTTVLGRFFDYGTVNVYAYGSWMQIPNIKDAINVYKKLESNIDVHIKSKD